LCLNFDLISRKEFRRKVFVFWLINYIGILRILCQPFASPKYLNKFRYKGDTPSHPTSWGNTPQAGWVAKATLPNELGEMRYEWRTILVAKEFSARGTRARKILYEVDALKVSNLLANSYILKALKLVLILYYQAINLLILMWFIRILPKFFINNQIQNNPNSMCLAFCLNSLY
jgi:hypothetical protein